jgi:glycosyltransferase involved in cell wall biosynthesis
MTILFISSWFPFPPDNGSRIRVFNLIKQLSREHEIALLSFSRGAEVSEERLEEMRRYCSRVVAVPLAPFRPSSFRSALGFLSPRPRSFVDTHSPRMEAAVSQVVRENDISLVIASQLDAAPYAAALSRLPRILEEIELTKIREQYTRETETYRRLRYGLTWWKTKRFAAGLVHEFDACTVVSEHERENVLRIAPGSQCVAVVPNGVDVALHTGDFGPPRRGDLVFPGALTYGANLDAMEFFLHDVFPLVRERRSGVILRITGRTDGVPVDRLPLDESVVLTGYLDDVRPTVARSWVCVVPLRLGGGTRLKILEAMALGTPVVATSKGAEGLDVTPGKDILIADDPADFAIKVSTLLEDPALRERISEAALRLVRERYDWDVIGKRILGLVEETTSRFAARRTLGADTGPSERR